jgi:structural maintenance of chromosome 4
VAEPVEGEAAKPADDGVKQEPNGEAEPKQKKPSARTPAYELHIYSAEELADFKKREMIADAELLDGLPPHIPL